MKKKNGIVDLPKLSMLALYLQFTDYNFDDSKDIYINRSSNNGYSIRRGMLITLHGSNKKMRYHPEASDLGNMQPNKTDSVVISEKMKECEAYLRPCKISNKWKKGKLITVHKQCPC